MQQAQATNDAVSCPHCQTQFEVTADLYNAVVECEKCGKEFQITPPATSSGVVVRKAGGNVPAPPPPPPVPKGPVAAPPRPGMNRSAPGADTTSSGIQVDDNLKPSDYRATGTVRLSRDMTMVQKVKSNEMAPPPPVEKVAAMKESVASDKSVACPSCKSSFEITPEFYGAVAECPDCSAEFVIKPPGSAPRPPPAPPKPALPKPPAKPATPAGGTPASTASKPAMPKPPVSAPAPAPAAAAGTAPEATPPAADPRQKQLMIGGVVAVVVILLAIIAWLVLKGK